MIQKMPLANILNETAELCVNIWRNNWIQPQWETHAHYICCKYAYLKTSNNISKYSGTQFINPSLHEQFDSWTKVFDKFCFHSWILNRVTLNFVEIWLCSGPIWFRTRMKKRVKVWTEAPLCIVLRNVLHVYRKIFVHNVC